MSIVAEAPSEINRLALEQVVAEAIQAVRTNDRNSLECARKGGEALQTLKDDGARGEWLKFLARLQMSASTAASWRRVAHFWEKLNLQRAASLREAVAKIKEYRAKEKARQPRREAAQLPIEASAESGVLYFLDNSYTILEYKIVRETPTQWVTSDEVFDKDDACCFTDSATAIKAAKAALTDEYTDLQRRLKFLKKCMEEFASK